MRIRWWLAILAAVLQHEVSSAGTVSLVVSRETVPAGAIAQVKVFLTEPMPMSKGGAALAYDTSLFGAVQGIHLLSPAGDVSGTALVMNGRIALNFISPQGTFGTTADYPILTLALPVKAGAAAGSSVPVTLDSLWLADLLGFAYTPEVKPGWVRVGGSVAINNVLPGGGTLPAYQPFVIQGVGFQPGARVRSDGMGDLAVDALSAGAIQVSPLQPATLDGQRIIVANPDGTGASYYSYLRGVPLGASAQPLLAATVPVLPTGAVADALISPVVVDANAFTGWAAENASSQVVPVTVSLYTSPGVIAAQASFSLPPGARISRAVFETFSRITPTAGLLRITAGQPVRVMGLWGNNATGVVLPISATPTPAGF